MINIICLKWGERYSAEWVNRLYTMVERNCKSDFQFYCCTEDPNGIRSEVNIIPLQIHKYNIDKWWWKLWFFSEEFPLKEKCLYFDLDTVIQNDISEIVNYEVDKPHFLKGYLWGNPDFAKPDMANIVNSSIMLWDPGTGVEFWDKFIFNYLHYGDIYRTDDNYIEKEHPKKFRTLPAHWTYSRFAGYDTRDPNNNNPDIRCDTIYDPVWAMNHKFYYMPDRMICCFAGSHWKLYSDYIREKMYDRFEKYWN